MSNRSTIISAGFLPVYVIGVNSQQFIVNSLYINASARVQAYTHTCQNGSFAFTGKASNLVRKYTIFATADTFTLIGNPVGVYYNHNSFANVGNILVTGSAVNFVYLKITKLVADSGIYTCNGIQATFDKFTPNVLNGNSGAFKVTGNESTFAINSPSNVGNYILTGSPAVFSRSYKITAGLAEYSYSGNFSSLIAIKGYFLHSAKGSYSLTGKGALLRFSHVLKSNFTAYSFSFGTAKYIKNRVIKGSNAVYSASFGNSNIRKNAIVLKSNSASFSVNPKPGYAIYRELVSGPGEPIKLFSGPFYFAWANENETSFSSYHLRNDERILSFSITHEEGQIPLLSVDIKNPNINGLNNNPFRYAWLSYDTGASVEPLFFGKVVDIPSDLLGDIVTLKFVARSSDYLKRKNILADSLRVLPFYDPIFLTEEERKDPDIVLEGYSAAWHVDRVTQEWTISDLITGEDGTDIYNEEDAFYDSLKINISNTPIKTVNVRADVLKNNDPIAKATGSQFTNKRSNNGGTGGGGTGGGGTGGGSGGGSGAGYGGTGNGASGGSGKIFVGNWCVPAINADNIVNQWPKTGTNLGGGWFVDEGYAVNIFPKTVTQETESFSWSNRNTQHAEGDTMSVSYNRTTPIINGKPYKVTTNPLDIVNNSSGYTANYKDQIYLPGCVVATLSLRYEYGSNPQILESSSLTLNADLNTAYAGASSQEADTLTFNLNDPTTPIINSSNSYSVANTNVPIGKVITDENGHNFISLNAGNTSETTPYLDTTTGTTTKDGDVVWAALGKSASIIRWNANTNYNLGAIIEAPYLSWVYYSSLSTAGIYNNSGVDVSEGVIVKSDDNLSYQRCKTAGQTAGNKSVPQFSKEIGATTQDGSVVWESLGPALFGNVYPSGVFFICTQAGVSGNLVPKFNIIENTETTDGTAIWKSLGSENQSVSRPFNIPDWSNDKSSYYSTDRGQQSTQHMIARARARVLSRARAFELEWTTSFDRGLSLSCRKSATIYDNRLPNGSATGKIVKYEIYGNGDNGEFLTNIKIACTIGNGGTVSDIAAENSYANDYTDNGYQAKTDGLVTLPTNDVGYIPNPTTNNIDPNSGLPISNPAIGSPIYLPATGTNGDTGLNVPFDPGSSVKRAEFVGGGESGVMLFILNVSPVPDGATIISNDIKSTTLKIPSQI